MFADRECLLDEDLREMAAGNADLWRDLRKQKIFITGGTGFLGCWLTESLAWANRHLGLGIKATLLTRDEAAFRKRALHLAAAPGFSMHQGDILSFKPPKGDFSLVIHGAGAPRAKPDKENPLSTIDTITEGTRRCLDFAVERGVEKFLFISSGAVYGQQPPAMAHMPEDFAQAPDPMNPLSAYGQAKRLAENLCAVYGSKKKLKAKVARCFTFIGPYMPLESHFAAGNFIRDALQGGPIRIEGDGTTLRSYLYASDCAAWLWRILLRGQALRPYNVGSERGLSITRLARETAKVLRPTVQIRIAQKADSKKPAERYVPSTQRIQSELGARQTIDLPESIRRTAKWHQARFRV